MTIPALLDPDLFRLQPDGRVVQSSLSKEAGHDVNQSDRIRRRPSADELASMVTHELRNPLNALGGWLHLLAADPAANSDANRRALAGARRAVEQQLGQIDRVGQLLRLSGGSAPPPDERIELVGLLNEAVRRQSDAANAAGHDIRLRHGATPMHDEPTGCWVCADRALLENALDSLMSFALRHGTPGAVLELDIGQGSADEVSLVMRIDEGEDAGLSVWHAFGQTGIRLALDLYVAVLAIESCGGSVLPRAAPAGGQELEIRLPASSCLGSAPRA